VAKRLIGSGCRWDDEWGRSRDGCVDGCGDRRRVVLWANLGRPIVTNGVLLHSCVEVCEPIDLSFGVVSGWARALMY